MPAMTEVPARPVHLAFWWKPGCATNTRQIGMLAAAGCEVSVRDLLTEAWTAATLAPFMHGRPVADWFNPAAPAVKQGRIEPGALTDEQALAMLLAEPLLIRRPLLQAGAEYCCGFDAQWLAARGVVLGDGPLPQGCSHPASPPDSRKILAYDDPAAYCRPPSGPL